MAPLLTDEWTLGCLRVPNRVMLAPLAGIGNWFVRLQAKRYGAGMAVSEMVSSHAIHHRNRRTCEELLRIDPREREAGVSEVGGIIDESGTGASGGTSGAGETGGGSGAAGTARPVSIQLFGADPRVMRLAAARAAEAGADAIDLNMGCPVPKVCKTGAGAALLGDQERALALARAAIQGSGLPVTVKLRSGQRPRERSGLDLARRLVEDAGVAAIALHPRSAAVRHAGSPDYELAGELAQRLEAPLILSGGLRDREGILAAFETSGASAVMLARGALGNPWLFAQLLDENAGEPTATQVKAELRWMAQRACEHLGSERATRWMRKAYPWYVARLRLPKQEAKALQEALQRSATLAEADDLLERATAGCGATRTAGCGASRGDSPSGETHSLAGKSPRYTPALATA